MAKAKWLNMRNGDDCEKVVKLIDLYDQMIDATASFEEDYIGADLVYLMGAILKDDYCQWVVDRPIVVLLKRLVKLRPEMKWVLKYIHTFKTEAS